MSLSENNALVFSKSTKVWEHVATLHSGSVTPVGHELHEQTRPSRSTGERDEREADATGHLARR